MYQSILSHRIAAFFLLVFAIFVVIFIPSPAHAATRTIADGGGNYNSTSTWVEGAVPTSADDVVATATSGQLTVNVSSAAKSINLSSYTNTLTMNAVLTVSGNVTLGSGMTISGSSALTVNAAATLTSNGKTWPNGLNLTGAVTFTLADDWTVTGSVAITTVNSTTTLNGNTLYIGGDLSAPANTGHTEGTTNFVLNGTGTLSQANQATTAGRGYQNNITINTSGTITISGQVACGNLTYVAGTVVTTGSTLFITKSATLDINGISIDNLTFNGGATATYTLSSDITVTGTLNIITSNSIIALNGSTIYAGGSLTSPLNTGSITGTTDIVLNGN